MSAFKEKYKNEVVPALIEKFKYRNIMEVPRLEKIVVNMGVGEGSRAPKLLDAAAHDLALITGQKAIITKAKKSIAAFKVRTGMPVGCRVTLRGERMYDFFSRLINVTLPRLRDFRGVSAKSFDGRGNYSLGIREQTVFPEIDYDKVEHVQGMDITVVTTAKSDEEAKELLAAFGMPFKD
jgi:large subunit ribosomal protein L5